MKRNISDLLDRYPAEDVELGQTTPYSQTRIKEITMKHIQTETKTSKRRFQPARLLGAAAVAAAVVCAAVVCAAVVSAVPDPWLPHAARERTIVPASTVLNIFFIATS